MIVKTHVTHFLHLLHQQLWWPFLCLAPDFWWPLFIVRLLWRVSPVPKHSLEGADWSPGSWMTTVLNETILSAVGSVAIGTMSKGLTGALINIGLCIVKGGKLVSTGVNVGRWCAFLEVTLEYFVRLRGTGVEEKTYESGSISTRTLAKGLEAMCSISFCCRWRLLCVSMACLNFHSKTHMARNRKKQLKNTEKNTNRSIWGWSCLKYKFPYVPPPLPLPWPYIIR